MISLDSLHEIRIRWKSLRAEFVVITFLYLPSVSETLRVASNNALNCLVSCLLPESQK